jgi:hypothetical protein
MRLLLLVVQFGKAAKKASDLADRVEDKCKSPYGLKLRQFIRSDYFHCFRVYWGRCAGVRSTCSPFNKSVSYLLWGLT